MNPYTKETVVAWSILIGAVLVGGAIGYIIGNDSSLDALEERIETLQLQANEVNEACIAELQKTRRLLQREANFNTANSTVRTNGI